MDGIIAEFAMTQCEHDERRYLDELHQMLSAGQEHSREERRKASHRELLPLSIARGYIFSHVIKKMSNACAPACSLCGTRLVGPGVGENACFYVYDGKKGGYDMAQWIDVDDCVRGVGMSNDGMRLALGCMDGRVLIFHFDDREERFRMTGEYEGFGGRHVSALVFSPDGRRLVAGRSESIDVYRKDVDGVFTLRQHIFHGWEWEVVSSLSLSDDAGFCLALLSSFDRRGRFDYFASIKSRARSRHFTDAAPGDSAGMYAGDNNLRVYAEGSPGSYFMAVERLAGRKNSPGGDRVMAGVFVEGTAIRTVNSRGMLQVMVLKERGHAVGFYRESTRELTTERIHMARFHGELLVTAAREGFCVYEGDRLLHRCSSHNGLIEELFPVGKGFIALCRDGKARLYQYAPFILKNGCLYDIEHKRRVLLPPLFDEVEVVR